MSKPAAIAPVMKWVGGKRQLLGTLRRLFPERITPYCEPFLGGGAVLFSTQPEVAYVNDINEELINVYTVIRDHVEELIEDLNTHENSADYFYRVRDWDRDRERYNTLFAVQRASRMLYLNKTCYNGLFRVNSAGEFNSPFGNYKNPNIVNASTLRSVHTYFTTAQIHFSSVTYAAALECIPDGTFVYLDPPYDPISTTAGFTGYAKGGFGKEEQCLLKACCDTLHKRGLKFMLSNSATNFIIDLYKGYNITKVQAKRAINSISTKRGEVDEVVVRNYD